MKFERNRNNVLLLELIIFIMVTMIYVFYIKDMFAYMGFEGDASFHRIVKGYLSFFTLLIIGRFIRGEFFYTVWHMMFILFYFGQVIFYQYGVETFKPLVSLTIFLTTIFLCSFIKIDFRVFKIGGKIFTYVLLLSLILFLPIFLRYYKYINLSNLLLLDIYDVRYYFREFNDPYFGYVRAPLSRVILPSLLIISILRKQVWLGVLSIGMILFIFMVGALKSIFVGLFAAVLFYFGNRLIDKLYTLLYLFAGLSILGPILYHLFGSQLILSSFLRRVLFTPALLDSHYYNFYGGNFTYWGHNLIGELFFDYPYEKPPNTFIGEDLLEGRLGDSANVGIITEGFFSMGFFGVFLHSLFVSVVLIILKRINSKPIFFGIMFVYVYYLNTSFLTVLLITHGLVFYLFYAYVFLNRDYEK